MSESPFWKKINEYLSNPKIVLGLIFGLAIIARLICLGYPDRFYFDEVYHGFTAKEYLHGNVSTYDPWAKPPPGLAYEWTHPPLAKLIMSVFMMILGENAWGWRMGSVVFSLICIYFLYLFLKENFSKSVAVLGAFFLAVDGSFLAQSRIAMNDVYFMAFMLIFFWSYQRWKKQPDLKKWPFWVGGLALGLAASCKWTALYIYLILAVDLLILNPLFFKKNGIQWMFWCFVGWIILPLMVYLLSYAQFFYFGWDWDRLVELQKQMWWYHSRLKATHPFQSQPWQWVLNVKPVWMYLGSDAASWEKKDIYNLGNSVVYWGGFLSLIVLTFRKAAHQDSKSLNHLNLLSLCYLGFWVPWTFSPRIMFSYHYLPAVPFLCGLLAVWVDGWSSRYKKAILIAAFIWFFIFYPFNTGVSVSKTFSDSIYGNIPRSSQ